MLKKHQTFAYEKVCINKKTIQKTNNSMPNATLNLYHEVLTEHESVQYLYNILFYSPKNYIPYK